jgi:hypothetical protein
MRSKKSNRRKINRRKINRSKKSMRSRKLRKRGGSVNSEQSPAYDYGGARPYDDGLYYKFSHIGGTGVGDLAGVIDEFAPPIHYRMPSGHQPAENMQLKINLQSICGGAGRSNTNTVEAEVDD